MKLIRKILILPISLYQYLISPLLGNRCRFYPSCSEYTKEALTKLPLPKAVLLSTWRILRCHPFAKGGYDPLFKEESQTSKKL